MKTLNQLIQEIEQKIVMMANDYERELADYPKEMREEMLHRCEDMCRNINTPFHTRVAAEVIRYATT